MSNSIATPWTLWIPTRLLCPWDVPGKNTGVGCHFLLQGIFLTQGSNPGLLHCRQTLYPLSHHKMSQSTGSPRVRQDSSQAPLVKNLPANAGDLGSIPGLGKFPREGNGKPLQYSCLRNSMDREAWRATV